MIHIGLICPPTLGHLNPTLSLGKALSERGFKVSMIGWPETKDIAYEYNIDYILLDTAAILSKNYLGKTLHLGTSLSGIESVKYSFDRAIEYVKMSFSELPDLLDKNDINLLIADHVLVDVPTICDYLNLPFITLCNALVSQSNSNIAASFYLGTYETRFLGKIKNIFGHIKYTLTFLPLLKIVQNQRKKWNLKPIRKQTDFYSPLAVISQQTTDIEYPLNKLNKSFNYVGPLIDLSELYKEHDIHFSNERPIIYASLGTINTGQTWIYKLISDVCKEMFVNLILSMGRSLEKEDHKLESEFVKVRSYVPQLSVLRNCSLCITHAGLNTTMHCILTATPMIAIPIGNEQPGVASRIQWSGAGLALPLEELSQKMLCDAISKVLFNPKYEKNLSQFQRNCIKSGGLNRAVEIIENIIKDLPFNHK